ncbi:MAG: response regulator transcription factor [Parasporobacterium sp.]|nr:response regulator transcription factor [Parasporobacterium sp.]
MKLLFAEDEKSLSRAVSTILEKNNYSVDAVYDGQDALDYLETGDYDAAILDIMMPKMDGITVLKKIRAEGIRIPVIMLTAKSEIDDKVLGLDSGANDYLTKPFDTKELLARLRAITRPVNMTDSKITFGNLSLDRATFELSTETDSIRLAGKEFQMMEMLLAGKGQLISTDRFLEHIWGYETEVESNVVWVYISYLRKKLEKLKANVKIKASRNMGYYLEEVRGQA